MVRLAGLFVLAASTAALASELSNNELHTAAQASPQESSDQRKLVPGTRVRLAPPPGHSPGKGFLGYQWEETGASLLILEMPAPYAEVGAGFDAEGMAKKGMTLLEASDARFGVHEGKLVHATQRAQGVEFEKWMAVLGDERRTVMITANFPQVLAEELSAPFKEALLGATWDPKLEIDPFEILPWTITAPKGLKFAANMGTTLIFTENGEVDQKATPASPRLMVSPSIGNAKIVDARKFAESRLRKLPGFGSLELESSTEFSAGGRAGWEIVATAVDEPSGVEIVLHQILLVGDGEYHLFVAQSGREQRETWLPRFRACAASWKLKAPRSER